MSAANITNYATVNVRAFSKKSNATRQSLVAGLRRSIEKMAFFKPD